ncbi:hypothetical protein PGIGA_G00194270 [Pangasianodon gigas]|uniref:Uncharacterized protein n=1 Tax=Pangasianodon gigas TaxID=30993 RepID=A0ACC5XWD4_PANGG|nr:hypothetical protein [Pangasianodon gigas]
MASFFRRSVSSQLVRICGGSEEVFIPLLSAVPVSKRQLTPDFRLTVSSLVQNGILSPEEDLLSQTEHLAKQKVLSELREDPQAFGVKSEILRTLPRGRTLVEYSSPNIAKKFHAGHLRSTIIGHFIANLKQALGNDVIRVNYLGDWGMQFGLLGAGFQRLGSEEKLKENALQHLFEVYVQVNREAEHDESLRSDAAEFFRRLEQHEEQALLLWKQDVAAALERKQTFGFDEMIYVTDKSQSVHFQQLFQILCVMGHHWAQRLLR